ncbi:unnamed protein product [Sphenostylis stenocarpa]|uniref:CST complex subunit CTC1 n=1 Tax=Sphenostylis stenocarpa TaxID=92480 RepID=A0AA87B8S8_9FABA|nr:unnamed protein product [Sphenostylis stenocarpa]
MDDANATVTTLAELLHSPRPHTATASASSLFSSTPPLHRSTTHRVLTALPRPTVLVGTLTLPTLPPPPSLPCSCLRFSDTSATLCCDLLHFRPAALNREIRVTSWNFVPFKRHGRDVAHGLLEIINWRFSDPSHGSNALESLPLALNCGRQTGARTRSIHGVVESVGPISVVPCTMAASTSDLNSGSKVNLPGFLVQLVCCECKLCCSKEVLIDKLSESRKGHSFTKTVIVYFCGSASSWHPAITKMIGVRVVVSGLKKKVVYVTKEVSQVMYVTVDESVLHVGSCSENCIPSLKSRIKGKGESGAYTGVVKGVYMQGMVLELDHDVWLLLTDQLHTSMHGLRVGSILSVRNVHFVNPKFSWTKIIILGACIKTSIVVQSFSPSETVLVAYSYPLQKSDNSVQYCRCNVVFPSTGMLGKFTQSLPFSARLWVLLLVSSFRKKFAGVLSDKEILGSKHVLPERRASSDHGALVGLCTHDLNGCGRVLHCSFLKLIDPSTRRLRLVDATGGVDIFIPDLPLTWNPNEIYEVTDYEVLVDSIGEPMDQSKFLGSDKAGSSKSSTFVEAILFPFILLFAGKSRIAHPCNASCDKTKELLKSCLSSNKEDKFSNKRQKLIKESVSSSKDGFQSSIYGLSACSNSSRKPAENKKCVSMRSFHDLSCLVTFKILQNESEVCPAILRSTSPIKDTSFNSKPSSKKILLEFSSDRFLKYQLLQIGDYYIIDHNRNDCFGSSTKDADFGISDSAKLLVDSGKNIWSLSFVYDKNLSDHLSEYTSAKDSLFPTIDGVLHNHQKLLPRSKGEPSGVCSDVCLYLPISLANMLGDNVMELEDSQSLQFAISEDSANLSSCTETLVARPKSCFGSQRSNSLFPEGNLISLEGNVIEIHEIGSGFFNSCSNGANIDALQLKGLIETRSSFCIHVNICGSVNKHTFPTGFGPGVTATFHRILNARDKPSFLNSTKDADNASQNSISCLIFQLPQSLSHKQIVLRCRVVAVFVLVIERKSTNLIAETKSNAMGTLLDIPLASFLLEDGSSSCCCWARAERAATLLRLPEELTTSHHLGRILKRHKRITVKSHGLYIDSPYQDHIVSVTSGNALCSSDENILKLIIFNACIGGIWNVVGSGMDAEETRQLEKEYLTDILNVQNMRNIWAEEVSYSRTLAEARNMIQELLKR